ncbi:gamma-interferon-inducible lysosomal thiol reductase-like [Achroia grisella]|uniref:gamma-interferon-inducible lysosomal thiol reductase-like n=1 Tax=Achroia grisella TaxID=688607 RepID=UPI0027D2E5B0|nr:gamma-interferon-inducible lysosomal thiol reductase-like [Achroia grisella]
MPTVLKLIDYLDIYTYPYGKANTTVINGKYEFTCQHQYYECYGNKLHACAIHALRDVNRYVRYNACLMDRSQRLWGSDDDAVDQCGNKLGVDSNAIKICAKGNEGSALLNDYGVESKNLILKHVPHICINGVPVEMKEDLMQTLCDVFNNIPKAC